MDGPRLPQRMLQSANSKRPRYETGLPLVSTRLNFHDFRAFSTSIRINGCVAELFMQTTWPEVPIRTSTIAVPLMSACRINPLRSIFRVASFFISSEVYQMTLPPGARRSSSETLHGGRRDTVCPPAAKVSESSDSERNNHRADFILLVDTPTAPEDPFA